LRVLKDLLPYKPKIIATVRNIDDCAASFVRVAKPNNVEDFLRNDGLIGHLKESYTVLHSGFQYDKDVLPVRRVRGHDGRCAQADGTYSRISRT
jgi:hypothetical protein